MVIEKQLFVNPKASLVKLCIFTPRLTTYLPTHDIIKYEIKTKE